MKNLVIKILSNEKIIRLIKKYYKPYNLRIICYHSISQNHNFLPKWLCINPDNFIEQLNYLKNNFNIISFSDIKFIKEKKIKNPLIITFDDGLKDGYEKALPILKSIGIKATFFINTLPLLERKLLWIHNIYILEKIIGLNKIISLLSENDNKVKPRGVTDIQSLFDYIRKNYNLKEVADFLKNINLSLNLNYDFDKLYMNKSELISLVENEMELGCHGHSHFYFSKLKTFNKEGVEAKKFLESLCDKKVEAFAYPFGDPKSFNKYSDLYLKEIFNDVCTTIPKTNGLEGSFTLGRVCSYEMSKEKIALKLLLGY